MKNPELYTVQHMGKKCKQRWTSESTDMFEEDGPGGKAVLKPYAVPTIFKWLAEVGAVPCSRVILHLLYPIRC